MLRSHNTARDLRQTGNGRPDRIALEAAVRKQIDDGILQLGGQRQLVALKNRGQGNLSLAPS